MRARPAQSRCMRAATLSRPDQEAAEGAGALAGRPLRRRGSKVFVDTAAVMEKPLAQAAGLGWQGKHTNLVSREFRLVAVSRRDSQRSICRARPRRPIIAARAGLPRYMSDRRVPGALTSSTPGAAFPTSPSRTRDRSRRNFARPSATASTVATNCLAVCPWNKFAQTGREAKLAARDELRAPSLADLAASTTRRFGARFCKIAGQAHRPRPLSAQRADRDRQLERPRLGGKRPSGC